MIADRSLMEQELTAAFISVLMCPSAQRGRRVPYLGKRQTGAGISTGSPALRRY